MMILLLLRSSNPDQDLRSNFESVYRFNDLHVCLANNIAQVEIEGYEVVKTLEITNQVYFVAQKGGSFESENPSITPLLSFGRYLFVDLDQTELGQLHGHNDYCWSIEPLDSYREVIRHVKPDPTRVVARIRDYSISKSRLELHMKELCKYASRFTFSDSFVDATTYCENYLRKLGYIVHKERFEVSFRGEQRHTYNVVASKPSTADSPKTFILCGHLDSIHKEDIQFQAPGADDNASGSAGVLEIAEQLALNDYPNNLAIILFGGEEIGLTGSKYYVSELPADQELLGVINMDMIGRKNGNDYGVLIEGADVSKVLATRLSQIASDYTSLLVNISFNPYASDHVPFIERGYPALLTIEASDSSNIDIHTEHDTLDKVDYDLMSEILLANLICADCYLNGA